jgi:hypothetical protein
VSSCGVSKQIYAKWTTLEKHCQRLADGVTRYDSVTGVSLTLPALLQSAGIAAVSWQSASELLML